jgi:hypothetical protein
MAAAKNTPAVRDWLTAPEPASTEDLPSHLQSRWVDASSLPSHPLSPDAIQQAAATEARDYQALFGTAPKSPSPPPSSGTTPSKPPGHSPA